jgi:hypothetical protein
MDWPSKYAHAWARFEFIHKPPTPTLFLHNLLLETPEEREKQR